MAKKDKQKKEKKEDKNLSVSQDLEIELEFDVDGESDEEFELPQLKTDVKESWILFLSKYSEFNRTEAISHLPISQYFPLIVDDIGYGKYIMIPQLVILNKN
jgi:hypothetical protein